MAAARAARVVRAGVAITHPDKVLFPEDGYTKLDLVEHYERVAPYLLPFLRDRPLTLRPFPRGIGQPGFYLKDAPRGTPSWVPTWRDVAASTGKPVDWIVGGDRRTLLWLANYNAIEVHAWLARIDQPDRPDWLVFDLDPDNGLPFRAVGRAARLVGAALDRLGLRALAKTSGQSGIHVLVPLVRSAGFDAVRDFARRLSEALAAEHPDLLTASYAAGRPRGRVLLDYAQNSRGRTTVAPYSVRPRPGAPVSTPLQWDELDDPGLEPGRFTLRTLPARLAAVGDLLGPLLGLAQRLPDAGA